MALFRKKERPPPGPIFVTGDRWFVAELSRFKGQLLLRQGHSEAADELYRKALSIAREQEAKLWELRAAASLAC
jgi:predicted ATPase